MDDRPGFEKVRVRACRNRSTPPATRKAGSDTRSSESTAPPPRAKSSRTTPAIVTDRAAKLLRSGRCTPAVRAAKTTAVSIGPFVTKTVTNAERRFGGKIIPYPNCDAVDRLGPSASELGSGEKSASEAWTPFWPS